jgi:hypothetical protein
MDETAIKAASQGLCHPAQLRALLSKLDELGLLEGTDLDARDIADVAKVISAWKSDEVQIFYYDFFDEAEREENESAFRELMEDLPKVFDERDPK